MLARQPTNNELDILERGWHYHRSRYEQQPKLIKELLQATNLAGNSSVVSSNSPVDVAAYVVICNLIFNLDETVIRE